MRLNMGFAKEIVKGEDEDPVKLTLKDCISACKRVENLIHRY